ncbi:MAG: outer membrane beta-barrel protein [Flavobacteriales bacterium]|nr:outer membrane beta-barrel protein [Flavobacteriales bacterium]
MPIRSTFALLLSLISASVIAQRPSGAPPSGRMAGGPAIGRVYGRVIDAGTGKGAEYTTVAVRHASKDSIIGGTITRSNGEFAVDKLPIGPPLKVTISFIGYTPFEKQVQLTRDRLELDMGNITLKPDAEQLGDVEVTAERATMVMQVDRRVFTVDKDLSAQGGTGVDVMKNVPGLSVDLDGNVQMRGASPQILVNGRPTSMTLEQIPAEDIEKIEVITNPSVAFDANTTGGIINVVLKKTTKPGYSGQAQLGAGTNNRYQAGLNLNMKEGRWTFGLSYNHNTSRNLTDGTTDRTERSAGITTGYFNQDASSTHARTMHGGRFSADWQVTNRNVISLSQNIRFHEHAGSDQLDARILGAGNEMLSTTEQRNSNATQSASATTTLGFRRKAPKEGREWGADLTYNTWRRNSVAQFAQYSRDIAGNDLPFSPRVQDNNGGSRYDQLSLQADWAEPIGERNKLELGIKSSWKDDNTFLLAYVTSPQLGELALDTSLTNDYCITDIINAAYVNWQRKLTDHWGLQAGFRFEQTWFETVVRNKDITFSYRYPNGAENIAKALFPGIYLSRKWDKSMRELQVNLSRKISRPNFWQIMPFVMYADSRNVRIGNPALAPELSTLAEVNHLLPFLKDKGTWLTSLFGRHTQDVITSYATPLPSDTTLLLNTFVNGSYSMSGGWENIVKLEPLTGLQLTLSGTLQYTDVALRASDGGTRNEGFNWNAKAMVAWRFMKDWNMQLNGEYEGPRIQPQGRSIAQYGIDFSMNHDVTRKVSLLLSVNDVFFTRRWGSIIDTPSLYQESFRRREMRFVRLTLTWKFGEQNTSLFRRRQQQRQEPGTTGGEMDM